MIDIKKWTGTLLSLVAACLPGLASSAAIPITNLVQIVASDAATAKTVAIHRGGCITATLTSCRTVWMM